MAKYLDLAGLTAYDGKIKQWVKSGLVDITDDEIRALFITPTLYEAVDLGLPSGLKWADRNAGAEAPQDSGLYFSWGNIDGYAVDENGNVIGGYSFDSDTYSTTLGGQYTGSELDAEHDTATVNMGSEWRMPTSAETVELVENTDHYFIDLNGNTVTTSELNSSELRSICFVKKDETFDYDNRSNFIEFPFAGDCFGSLLNNKGYNSNVWSSSVSANHVNAVLLLTIDGGVGEVNGNYLSDRFYGYSVRGVQA